LKYSIVKITVDLYAPEATITMLTTKWIAKWESFHSRRIIFPVEPINFIMKHEHLYNCSIVIRDFCHIRLNCMDGSYCGPWDSLMDQILTGVRLDYFLGNELPRIANTAILKAPPYRSGRTHATWLELFEIDQELEHGKMVCELNFDQLVENYKNTKKTNTKETPP
jgi:hypothetical protein